MTANEPLTYTVPEVARMLGIGINQTYEAVRRREIPSIRIGRRLLVPRQRFLEHINGSGASDVA
jgi:excisionase family DNA binding protein